MIELRISAKSKKSFDAMRARLASETGPRYWRSLGELAETAEFREFVEREFPAGIIEWRDGPTRRRFMQIMAASFALAGMAACRRQPAEYIVPYVKEPENDIPGKPRYYASAYNFAGYGIGAIVESHEGRPTKIEGNPDHPASLGASSPMMQASVLTLYDPDRSQSVRHLGSIRRWEQFIADLSVAMEAQRARSGAGLRILTGAITSPTFIGQLNELLAKFPDAKWYQYEPVNRDHARRGAEIAFGRAVDPVYRFGEARVILSLDHDFLFTEPGHLRYAREFIDARRVRVGHTEMNRLYSVESTPTITGAKADHRLALRPSQVLGLAAGIAERLGVRAPIDAPPLTGEAHAHWMDAAADDLRAAGDRALITVGMSADPVIHALAIAMNTSLGGLGRTVEYIPPQESAAAPYRSQIRSLVEDLRAGDVELLCVIGGNPVYTAPADLNLAEAMQSATFRVRLGLYFDETSRQCHWHIPMGHELETWSDIRAFDGTATIIQPLIEPLYFSKSGHEFIEELLGRFGRDDHEIIREYWRGVTGREDDAAWEIVWRQWLHDGLIPDTRAATIPVRAAAPESWRLRSGDSPALSTASGDDMTTAVGLEARFAPDPNVWDGAYTNNPWMLELPKPITKLTWDNAALISAPTAERFELANEDVVELRLGERTIEAAVWITPGHPDDTVTLRLGYGRESAGHVGNGVGFNAYALRTLDHFWSAPGLELRRTGRRHVLACTQEHFSLHGREIYRGATLETFLDNPEFVESHAHHPTESLYPEFVHPDAPPRYAWGMSIDLTACIGCNACVTACQAENNIPVVGKEEVLRGREMHWIRVDRYYEGSMENPELHHQPVTCMHCETAPCEVVCPVAATVHSEDGLNQMVYNRCVGTRYCSNNCPYKVRRFNFLWYTEDPPPTRQMQFNPDVTVRSRGVMEKCTYCVQRINAAKIDASIESRGIRDGEVQTACQQACPTHAIIFGDQSKADTLVAIEKAQPHSYGMLAELNTRPRTTYLGEVRNPNPALEPASPRPDDEVDDHGGAPLAEDEAHGG